MQTRSKSDIILPRLNPNLFLTYTEPMNVKQALLDPKWRAAMKEEFDALQKNNTWSLVPLPPNRKAIGCKWVFRVKENFDGTLNKFKTRLVAKGFRQVQGFDFTETFSLVIKPITIRLILTLALSYKWPIQQLDVNNAFLNGILEEKVYMQQPQGFEHSDSTLVCILHKALYGLKQAPRQWFERLTTALIQFGFQDSKCDPSLFTYAKQKQVVYLLVYVDGIIIIGSSSSLVSALVTQLDSVFSLKQLGLLEYFLGIEGKHLPNNSLLLTQSKYIQDLLAKTHMLECNSINTHMVSSCKLSKIGSDTFSDPSLYRSVVGSLQYATITRPEIAYYVNKVCQFMSNPRESHRVAVKRTLRYLKGTLTFGLQLHPAPIHKPLSLHFFVILTRLLIQMTKGPLPVLPYSLVPISFHGGPKSSLLSPDPVQKLDTGLWHKLQLMLSGSRHCYRSLMFPLATPLFTVIISQLYCLLIIPFYTLEQSIWR